MNKKILGTGMALLVVASGVGITAAQAAPVANHGSAVSLIGKPDQNGHGKAIVQQVKQLAKQLRNLGARLDRQAARLTEYPDVAKGLSALANQARDLVTQVNAATTKVELRVLRQTKTAIQRQAGLLLDTVPPADLAELPENLQP